MRGFILPFLILAGVVSYLLITVVPKFEGIFEEMLNGAPLPAITRYIIGVSRWLCAYWWLAAFVTIVLLVIGKYLLPASYFGKIRRTGFIWVLIVGIAAICVVILALYLPMLSIIREMKQ